MNRSIAVVLVLVFLTALCTVVVKPAFSSADVAEDSWASKAPMQVARGALGVVAVNGKIYAIGGSAQDVRLATTKEFLGTNEEYDPETDTWTFKKGMPTPRAALAIATYQNKIYCIGGKNSDGYTGVNEVYDPQTDTWETRKPMPTARGFVTANVVNGRIYVIGGSIIGGGTTINEVYDPATDSWTTKTSMPAWAGPVSAVFDDKIYKFGGSKLQIYDPATDDWSEGTPPPSSVGGVVGAGVTTGVMAPKRIYAIGSSVGIYDAENDTWVIGAQKPISQIDLGVAVVDDVLYVVGGYTYDFLYALYGTGSFGPLDLNEQYTPLGYGSPDPSYVPPPEVTPPEITVLSPENKNYTSSNVSLVFAVNKPALWLGYSLDGEKNVTVVGNVTLTYLSNGFHNITVYANDTFGNVGASETVYFSVKLPEPKPEPFPTTLVAAASVATIAVIGVGLLVYFKKRKKVGG